MPVEYFHVVFTLPEQIAELAFYNQDVLYGILFRAASQTLLTLGADPQHLGAQLGFFAILHTWGQNLLFHPHLHVVVPGGGLSADSERFVPCRRRRFFLPVKVLSSLFRRLFLEALEDAFYQKRLQFLGSVEHLRDAGLFHDYLYAMEKRDWVVYAKPPFGGPEQVLKYLGRYTHRVAISNQRLLALKDGQVSFQWKDYREPDDKQQSKTHDRLRRGVHPPLSPPHPAARLSTHSLLRFPRQSSSAKKNSALCRQLLHGIRSDLLPPASACRELREALSRAVPPALSQMPTRPHAAHSGSARLSLAHRPATRFLMSQYSVRSPDCRTGRASGHPGPACAPLSG